MRAGSAILHNMRVSKWSNSVNNPPAIFTPITYYGDMNTFLQTAGLLSPANTQGVSHLVSGTPQAISFSSVQGTDLTGGGDGQRVNVVGNASSCCNSLLEWFNPAAFAVPGLNDRGTRENTTSVDRV